jgi:gamma-carbonic anhydrase
MNQAMQGLVLGYLEHRPQIGSGLRAAARAAIIGRATVGERAWFGDYASVRADGESIGIGANAWFGEHTTVHVADAIRGSVVGDDITVGRYGLVHACTLADGIVIGESSAVMDDVTVGAHAVIAADSVVPPRKELPGGFLSAGPPVKPVRAVTAEEVAAYAHALRSGAALPDELASKRVPPWAEIASALPRSAQAPLYPLHGASPRLVNAYVAPTAIVAGDVSLAEEASVFFGSAIHAGDGRITIGPRTNVQDNCLLATTRERGELVLGSGVTLGHAVQMGSASVGDDALIGMASRVDDGVVVEPGGCIAAGAWVKTGTRVRAGWIWAGRPARAFRELKPEERAEFARARDIYVGYANEYRR